MAKGGNPSKNTKKSLPKGGVGVGNSKGFQLNPFTAKPGMVQDKKAPMKGGKPC